MATGAEDSSVFAWIYGAIAALGGLGMAATAYLIRKTDRAEENLWQAHRDHKKETDFVVVENERRFALKEDLKEIKKHMDDRFDQLTDVVISAIKGHRNDRIK